MNEREYDEYMQSIAIGQVSEVLFRGDFEVPEHEVVDDHPNWREDEQYYRRIASNLVQYYPQLKGAYDLPIVNRLEVICKGSRAHVKYLSTPGIKVFLQDDGRTMKVFYDDYPGE